MGACSSPLRKLIALLVGEGTDDDHDEVDQRPDAEAAEGDQLQDAGADLADVEAVRAEAAEKEAQQECRQDAFFRHVVSLEIVI